MKMNRSRASALAYTLLATAATCGLCAEPAAAQDKPQSLTPLDVAADPNGVNILTGKAVLGGNFGISLPVAPRLTYQRGSDYNIYVSGSEKIGAELDPGTDLKPDNSRAQYAIHTGGLQSEAFHCPSPGVCAAEGNSGSEYSNPQVGGTYTQEKTGAVYEFGSLSEDQTEQVSGTRTTRYYATSITYPDGEELSFQYDIYNPTDPIKNHRTRQVDSNTGYSLRFEYWTAIAGQGSASGWDKIKTVTLVKASDPAKPLAKLSYTLDGAQATDLLGRTWTCSAGCGSNAESAPWSVSGTLALPGEVAPARQVTRSPDHHFLTQSVVNDGVTWTYSYSGVTTKTYGAQFTYAYGGVTVTGPDGYNQTFKIASRSTGTYGETLKNEFITEAVDSLGRKTVYDHEVDYGTTWSSHRLKAITYPEQNSVHLEHDGANNIIKRTEKAKPGSYLADIVLEANYEHSSTAPVLKWRPAWIEDGRDGRTDFSYTAQGLLEQQLDPTVNGRRKRTFIEYEAPAPGGSAVYRKRKVRSCEVAAANPSICVTPEPYTTFQYLGGTFLPTSVSEVTPADGITRTTVTGYDDAGRVLSVDGPRDGNGDAVYFRYDAVGRKTWEIGAADDAGRREARRFTYRNADDHVSEVETGYVTSAIATAFTQTFATASTSFDGRRNPVREQVSADGAVQAVTERSFNDRGLPVCTATRMDPASAAVDTEACRQAVAGTKGPDRITKNVYDAAAQLTQVREGVGSIEAAEATFKYTQNGKRELVIDANGNRAQLVYDGFDRQTGWVFPSDIKPTAYDDATQASALATSGAVNPNDYEEYLYDANGNRTSHRKRDGSTLTFQYDALNRMTLKIVPERAGLSSIHTRDVHYGYDYRGLQTFARFDSATGQGVTTEYDGFGRPTSTTIDLGGTSRTLGYEHDIDGARTELTYPDAVKISFTHDSRKRMTDVLEGALGLGVPLATISYDARGLRETLTGSGGDASNYQYDGLSRLKTMSHIFIGGLGNSQSTFSYNAASQVDILERTNSAYDYTLSNATSSYEVNGLNQYTSVSGLTQAHDANGNLTSDGTTTFTYDVENRMVVASGASNATLTYDPLGRLFEVSGPTTGTTSFLYDGDELLAEYGTAGNLTRRYVHGAGVDDPIVWYEGSTLAAPRFLHADHQGSVASIANADGTLLNINRYDEYGVAATENVGRFGYTGQIWLPEVKAYYYKARIYGPVTGRFHQIDPVGYVDQYNLYAYVMNDPVNKGDSTGKCSQVIRPDGTAAFVGICGNSPEAAEFIASRISDPLSRISEVEALAIAQGRIVQFRFGTTDLTGKEVRGASTTSTRGGYIGVTLDRSEWVVVRGHDAATGRPVDAYRMSDEEVVEHEIDGHVRDRLTRGPVHDEGTAIRRENEFRERRGESFRREGHIGAVLPRACEEGRVCR